MTEERRNDLQHNNANLTEKEIKQGYHFCYDWDELLIGSEDREFGCCTCSWEDPKMNRKMKRAKKRMNKKINKLYKRGTE